MSGADRERAEELRLLASELLERAEPGLRALLAGLRDRVERADHPPTCTWCPLCASVGLLRGERPELAAAILAQADGLVAVLRAVLAPDSPDPEPEPPHVQRVQHIDVRPAGQADAGC